LRRLTLEEVRGVAKHKVDTTERVDSPNRHDNQGSNPRDSPYRRGISIIC
jgi:hypothetical protein